MILANEGLTESQFYLLDALYYLGPLNQKVLSTKLSRSEGNITMVVNNLVKRKLIKKKQSGEDKRIYIIKLRKDGKKFYEKVFPKFLKAIMIEFNEIREKEHYNFQKTCKKIGIKNLNTNKSG
jgi:MarR family 2-MHQ and catechol resistance regulon transcriptional repressor